MAVTEAIEACRSTAQIDDNEEEGGQCVEAEMRAKPRQSDWQGESGGVSGAAKQAAQRAG